MAGNGWGPGIVDFSPLANLGQTFLRGYDDADKRARERDQRQALASLGQTLTGDNPDYLGAASKAFNSGDANTGLTLLKLGEQAKLRQQEVEASQSFGKLFSGGSASTAAPQAQAPAGGDSVAPASLIQNESGGNWQAQNNAVGAGGQRGHFGRLQFGQARLQEAAAAGAIPQGTTPQQFMASPELQQRAEAWHWNDIDNHIRQTGLDRAIGQTINGVPVTVEGMRAVAHLGGKGGLSKFITSGGRYNPADENGTRLSDYFARHGGGGQPTQVAASIGRVQQAPLSPPGVQVAENEQDVQRLEAEMAARQAAPVQMAQAAPQQGAPMADVPAQGAAPAQGFAIPQATGADIPPGDPSPQVPTQALIGWMANPRLPQAQRDLVKSIVENRQKWAQQSAGPTGDIKEYNFYRQQALASGKQPDDFTTWARANKAAGATNVSIDQKGEGEYAKTVGKSLGERMDAISKEGDSARQDMAIIGQIRQLGGQIQNLGSGAALQGWLAERGIKVGPNVSEIEAFNALVDKLTPQQRVPGTGASSDLDVRMFKSALPSLVRSPGGNELILSTLEAVANDKAARAEIADRALTGELKPQEAIKALRALPDPMAALKEARKDGFKSLTQIQQDRRPAEPPKPPEPPSMPAGARQAPDGKYYVPDPNRPGKYLQVQ